MLGECAVARVVASEPRLQALAPNRGGGICMAHASGSGQPDQRRIGVREDVLVRRSPGPAMLIRAPQTPTTYVIKNRRK